MIPTPTSAPNLPLNQYLPGVSQLVYGCMGLGGGWNQNAVSDADHKQARTIIETNLNQGLNLFDHADIYTFGKAEQAFGQVLTEDSSLRSQMYVQSKCGIRFDDSQGPKRYDFSAQWIQQSVDGILGRLNTEYLDVLMLHRPDPLMELDELAKVLETLRASGKVKFFGVSNMNSHQMRYIQSALCAPLVCNQLEMSLNKLDWLEDGILVGHSDAHRVNFSSGTLEYCQMNGIQLQGWGCMAQGLFGEQGLHHDAPRIQHTSRYVAELAEHYNASAEAIVLAWLMRHPARIQPVVGTTNVNRIHACHQATKFTLTREQWYQLYQCARGVELP
ncbi:aldo/keto reductase [Echinimonas agarilytica]|uniref:Aldo/keto reductase n=1 Tax=Echinimonas agarilytica TaxID=1215918 RepID=A0AA41W4Y5_9GAMM|nr:aldo/keto reductase [Echinimonas agarilytica]MCM2678861.1 aldo/keto reductase [Echinimonas agarilytica]